MYDKFIQITHNFNLYTFLKEFIWLNDELEYIVSSLFFFFFPLLFSSLPNKCYRGLTLLLSVLRWLAFILML